MKKDKSLIPIGQYCYKFDCLYDGPKLEHGVIPTVHCPYDSYKEINGVVVPWCDFLDKGGMSNNWSDEEYEKVKQHFGSEDALFDALPLDLLWDACKECGENQEKDVGIDRNTKEGIKRMEELDEKWIIKIKKLKNEKIRNNRG